MSRIDIGYCPNCRHAALLAIWDDSLPNDKVKDIRQRLQEWHDNGHQEEGT